MRPHPFTMLSPCCTCFSFFLSPRLLRAAPRKLLPYPFLYRAVGLLADNRDGGECVAFVYHEEGDETDQRQPATQLTDGCLSELRLLGSSETSMQAI
ncbi:uncharacterized protein B0T23DRAFT_382904 [Neurospora hispaniola]|uniref:Secreted protein n=1 Tax=Neurospora hispaniola TaxID=588809 RepID=A0AAJ0MQK5_9PEZI|nr:hypothetical protein B0T23DRAFT_382904 [Neurospora hispaniola]